ncbi:MAG: helix-turn-helix transcriptional regulator [Candidatus Bathyarchaeota archaeon]|nr:helix-turn-helix transcriptional regulator [Candidatus Bathyarchaeota archaeon]MDW8040164.1 helix-turn-helix domain-containing protein [Nitrososphaerota archaeon]
MNRKITLSDELRGLVETRMKRTLEGIEETLKSILKNQSITVEYLKEEIQSLEKSFSFLSQKWNLELLYILFFSGIVSFSGLRKVLGVNSRTLSDKLKDLVKNGYIERIVKSGPPIRVEYTLTEKGRNTVLLALPMLYYSSGIPTQ